MKGLLIKDFQLLKKQKMLVVISVFISLVFLYSNTSSIQFIAGYITIMFSFASVSTIPFDQHSNGMSFLLTLPVSRSSYAKEKYLLMLFTMAGSLAVSFVLLLAGVCTGRVPFNPDLLLGGLLSSALCSALVHAFMIPLQLKFEAEKSRIAMIVVIGFAYAVIFGVTALARHFHVDVSALLERLVSRTDTAVLILFLCAAVAGILGLSLLVSLHVVKKKEY